MSNKLTNMTREILAIENDIPHRFDYSKKPHPTLEDFELHTFEQMWGSTALGFGGIGGQAMTSARTYVFIPVSCDQECFVYFAGKFAYKVPYSEKLVEDIRNQKMESVTGSEKYRKDNVNEIIYFELNNWFSGIDYPNDEPFLSWMKDDLNLAFENEDWVKQNKLCVVESIVDMSTNFCITATKEWVENNCPKLLTDYSDFLRYPDEEGYVYGNFDNEFLEYNYDNIGIQWVD